MPSAARIVLLDEDPSIVELLSEGEGTARFVDADAHNGQLSLEVTPPQRFSANIPGWQYPIREQPGPGEFRYLQFAWKAKGSGVMIELANGGRWPPAQSAQGRYFAGKNSTPWQAVRVSDQAPRQWTIVTRDLWLDLGDVTLTGLAPTAMGDAALFDRIELLQSAPSDSEAK